MSKIEMMVDHYDYPPAADPKAYGIDVTKLGKDVTLWQIAQYVDFAANTHGGRRPSEILISAEQADKVFTSMGGRWSMFRGIKLEVKV